MKQRKKLDIRRRRRAARVSARVTGTAERPRLAVNRSNRFIYAQLIDDSKGMTLAAVWSRTVGGKAAGNKATKSDQAFSAGEALAKLAAEKKISQAVFDRRSAKFHGRVARFAEGAKKGGLAI